MAPDGKVDLFQAMSSLALVKGVYYINKTTDAAYLARTEVRAALSHPNLLRMSRKLGLPPYLWMAELRTH